MEHVKVTDEWLYQYMPVLDAAIISELENKLDTSYRFSRKFERRMKRLIRKEAHPWLGYLQYISKRAAVLLIGFLITSFTVTMSVEAYREKFFETIKTFFEDAFILSYFTNANINKLISKEPLYLPQGYVEIDRSENENYFSVTYQNEEGKLILWDQMLITDSGSITFDLEYDYETQRELRGNEVTIYSYSAGYKSGYYEYEEYSYMIVAEALKEEEIYQIFESIFE